MMSVRVNLHVTVHIPELQHLGAQLMATFAEAMQHMTDLQTTVHSINDNLGVVRTEIQALRDQIAAGGVVTQAELDSLDQTIQDTQTEAQSVLTQEQGL
jgi:predicted  nucleic acid-binding Zn-ribbon protein